MSKEKKNIDLVILGGGPAGLTAAIYASRAKINFILLENGILGGQVRNSYLIENYPGVKEVDGVELADKMQEQAESLGAIIDEFDPVENIEIREGNNIIETESYIYISKTVIIATGAVPRKLPIPNESKFEGKGIHYCAVCDGAMYEGKEIGVIGGGNSALEEAVFLTKFAKTVYMIRRYDYFRGEKKLIEEAENNDKIKILYNRDLVNVEGGDYVEKAIIRDENSKKESELKLDGVFGYIGTEPKSDIFKNYININKNGYIITDEKMTTNIKGVYAAGDIREKEYRQITTAVADGTIAALEAEKFIKNNN